VVLDGEVGKVPLVGMGRGVDEMASKTCDGRCGILRVVIFGKRGWEGNIVTLEVGFPGPRSMLYI
jgi:hypothetical protein